MPINEKGLVTPAAALRHCTHPPEHREPVCEENAYYVLCKVCGRGLYSNERVWRKPTPPKPVPEPECQHRRAKRTNKKIYPGTRYVQRFYCPACKAVGFQKWGLQKIQWDQPIC